MANKILVIDDEAAVLKVYTHWLNKAGFMVETAGTGPEGIAKARTGGYDLILLDLVMPGMDGIETLRQLRAAHPDVPVCIATGFEADYQEELQALAAEGIAFEVIRKSADDAQLITAVQGMLGGGGIET